jgi:hypothetical protein
MTSKHRNTDAVDIIPIRETNGNGMAKNIIVAVVIFCVTGWVAYISTRGLVTNENVAKLSEKVSVIENDHKNLKENVIEIKNLVVEIRRDQIRRYNSGK